MPKVVAVAYDEKRWSFTRSSNCKALTEKVLVFWMNGRLLEVVAYDREVVAQGSSAVCYIIITFFLDKKNIKGKDNNHFRFILFFVQKWKLNYNLRIQFFVKKI